MESLTTTTVSTAAKWLRSGKVLAIVKVIEDIQERLVQRHFYKTPDEAVFFTDSHGNAMDEAGRRLFYREGALWYVGRRHQVGIDKRSIVYALVPLLFPVVFLMKKAQDPFVWAVVFFAAAISLLLFMFFRARREQDFDMSKGRMFKKITYTEFRRKFFGYNSSVRELAYGGFFALTFACIFTLIGLLFLHGAARYILAVVFLIMGPTFVISLYSLVVRKAWERYRARHGIAADAFIRSGEDGTEQKSDTRKPRQ